MNPANMSTKQICSGTEENDLTLLDAKKQLCDTYISWSAESFCGREKLKCIKFKIQTHSRGESEVSDSEGVMCVMLQGTRGEV